MERSRRKDREKEEEGWATGEIRRGAARRGKR